MMSITKLFAELVRKASTGLTIEIDGQPYENPDIKYLFGNAQYIKDELDVYSRSYLDKFPLVALLTPVTEKRGVRGHQSVVSVNILIACGTTSTYSNEEREEISFEKILRPIYDRLLDVMKEDIRIDIDYDDVIPHDYSENYSYGRYGAYTSNGEEVSEPIDAINISSLELKINNSNCRYNEKN